MGKLLVGSKAPDFCLPSSNGGEFCLKDAKGKWLVLYFYPKDDTPGCTKEACNFRDMSEDYKNNNALIYGVSMDSLESHNKFIKKHALSFPLLTDKDKKTLNDYGIWKEKFSFGKTFFGIERTTYVIDPKGLIAKVFAKVKVDGHHQEVLDFIKKN